MSEQSYPLSWPIARPRTGAAARRFGHFGNRMQGLSVSEGINRLLNELRLLHAREIVISTNVRLKPNGLPYSGDKPPDDPGVAVYFKLNKRPIVLPCDRFRNVGDNLGAVAKHIEAMRGQERWGVGSLDQAFRGYQQLEDYTQGVPWKRVLGFADEAKPTLAEVESKYRSRAREVHPDMNGVSHDQMAELNGAIEMARKELTV